MAGQTWSSVIGTPSSPRTARIVPAMPARESTRVMSRSKPTVSTLVGATVDVRWATTAG